jgi:acetyl-CoA carboxylase biotin carboxyl carrier protein
MNFNEIQELIKLVNKSNLTEFKLRDKDFEVLIRTDKYQKGGTPTLLTTPQIVPAIAQAPSAAPEAPKAQATPTAAAPAESTEVAKGKNILEIKSPMVGTFYRSPGPDKPVFAKVGDQIKQGDVVCIIEAMKLFNEIESDVTGTIVKVLLEDASPVEYDQVLFLVEI